MLFGPDRLIAIAVEKKIMPCISLGKGACHTINKYKEETKTI